MRIGRGLQRAAAGVGALLIAILPVAAASSAAAEPVATSPLATSPLARSPLRAEPPLRVPTQITDNVGALSGDDRAQVQAALDQLSTDTDVDLWVVYVDTFDNPSNSDSWAAQTAELSSLGSNQILLAVATGGRAYAVNVPNEVKLSSSQLTQIAQTEIQPQLADDDWAGAAIAAANGYREALTGSGSALWWVAGGVVVIGGGGYLFYRSRRKSAAASATAPEVGPDGRPLPPPEPLDQLSARSVQTLIDTDNAVRASEFELSAAESEFGADAVASFRKAFDSARESLTAAFEIRQRVDDEIPEDEDTKRAMMTEILTRCAQAADTLDAESDRFDQLRDLKSRLPQVLAELPAAISAQEARLESAGATLTRLQQQYAATAVATVAGNVSEAGNRLRFARTSLQQATDLAAGKPAAAPARSGRPDHRTAEPRRTGGARRRRGPGGGRPGADAAGRRGPHLDRPGRGDRAADDRLLGGRPGTARRPSGVVHRRHGRRRTGVWLPSSTRCRPCSASRARHRAPPTHSLRCTRWRKPTSPSTPSWPRHVMRSNNNSAPSPPWRRHCRPRAPRWPPPTTSSPPAGAPSAARPEPGSPRRSDTCPPLKPPPEPTR